jgi:hypothetical protein
MTWMKRNLAAILGIAITLAVFAKGASDIWTMYHVPAHAQTTIGHFEMGVGTDLHTSCTVLASTTKYCFAADGLYISLNGAAYAQIAATAGVISFNGRTGAVLPATGDYTYAEIAGTPPTGSVTSVNGKTGAVVLGATTTVQ